MNSFRKCITIIIAIAIIICATIPVLAQADDCSCDIGIISIECKDGCHYENQQIEKYNGRFGEFIIQDNAPPLARSFNKVNEATATWALINLILAAGGIALAVLMAVRMVFKSGKDDEFEREENNDRARNKRFLTFAIPIIALIGTVLFFLTQDMNLEMGMINFWTLPQAVLFISGLLSYIFAEKKEKDEEGQIAT